MRYFVLFIFFNFTTQFGYSTELNAVRKAFYGASIEKEVCTTIYDKIKDQDYSKNPVMLGYKGVYTAIMAKYVWNPFSKWWYFQEGVANLEEAIKKDGTNIELVFLRYSVQTNAPSFLGYSDNIQNDKAFILKSIYNDKIRANYQPFIVDIINYLLGSDEISCSDKTKLTKIKTDLNVSLTDS